MALISMELELEWRWEQRRAVKPARLRSSPGCFIRRNQAHQCNKITRTWKSKSKTSEPFLDFTNDNHQNRSVGLSPIWASCLREGRDDETAGRSLSPPQTFPQSSWCWQSTALLITAKKQNDALTFGCFGFSCVHLNFSRTGPWSYLIKIHQQLQLTPKVGLVSHSNMKGKQIG